MRRTSFSNILNRTRWARWGLAIVRVAVLAGLGSCNNCSGRSMFMSAATAGEEERTRYRIELDCDGVVSRGDIEIFDVHHTTTDYHCFETEGSRCSFCSPRFEPACRGTHPGSLGRIRLVDGKLPLVDGQFTALDGSMGSSVYLWLGSGSASDKVCVISGALLSSTPTACLALPSRDPSPTCRFKAKYLPGPTR